MKLKHSITIDAPSNIVYNTISDADDWANVFPPTIYSSVQDLGNGRQTLSIWALANGEPKAWTSQRSLFPAENRIVFQQSQTQPPVKSMSGEWVLEERRDGTTLVTLVHHFESIDGTEESDAWISRAVDSNSAAELDKLANIVQSQTESNDLRFSFEDSVEIAANPDACLSLIDKAEDWERLLPHVASCSFKRFGKGLQYLEMTTNSAGGGTHKTASYRVNLGSEIVYKQFTTPPLIELHTGSWTFDDDGGAGCIGRSRHTVRIRKDAIESTLGADATVDDARKFVRDALGKNSLLTLNMVKAVATNRSAQ